MSDVLRNKVQAEKHFDMIETSANACLLFSLVTKVCNKVSAIDHFPTKMVKSLALVMTTTGNNMGLSEFYDGFVARRKAREVTGLSFDTEVLQQHLLLAKLNKVGGYKNNSKNTSYLLDIDAISDEQFYACLFLHTARDRYEECWTTLENNFTMGSDMIPTSVEDSYTLLQNFLKLKGSNQKQSSGGTSHNNNIMARMAGNSFQQQNFD